MHRDAQLKDLLLKELIPALGCTEPIALALAAAKAREVLGRLPQQLDIFCSGNVIKNVYSVVVPNSGGRTGLDLALAMGLIGGDSKLGLEVLSTIKEAQVEEALAYLERVKPIVHLMEGIPDLYIRVLVRADGESAEVTLEGDHSRFALIKRNNQLLHELTTQAKKLNFELLQDFTLQELLDFTERLSFFEELELAQALEREIQYNRAIAEEGLRQAYGAQIGRTLQENGSSTDPGTRSKVLASAGSDARMGGCSLPVIINGGSGNQGMTVSLPVIVHAEHLGVAREKLYKALAFANLVALYQKSFIGKLSAFCTVVTSAAAAGAGIGYLKDYPFAVLADIITNTIATAGGMVCDGAKPSCASKIALGLDNMLMALHMAVKGRAFQPGDGLVGKDVDETIRNIGRMARKGMQSTDVEILNIMLEK